MIHIHTYIETASLQTNISAQFITNRPSNLTRLQEKIFTFQDSYLNQIPLKTLSPSRIEPRFHGRRPRSPVTIPTELCRLGTGGTTVPVLMIFQFLSITRPIIQGTLYVSQGLFISEGRFTHNISRPCRSPAMPCPCHPRPCHSSQGHGTAWPSRKSLWTNCPRSASSGYHAEFHEVPIRRIPISDAGGQYETKHRLSWTRKRVVAAHYKKGCYTVGLAVGYFRLPCGHSRRTRHCRIRAGARHGMCELSHGMAGERHAMCESAFKETFSSLFQCLYF